MQYDKLIKEQSASRAKLKQTVQSLPTASQSTRAAGGQVAANKQLRSEWKKGGGKIHDPAFSKLLRGTLLKG